MQNIIQVVHLTVHRNEHNIWVLVDKHNFKFREEQNQHNFQPVKDFIKLSEFNVELIVFELYQIAAPSIAIYC